MLPSVGSEKKSPTTPQGIDPATLRLVAQLLNHYAIPCLLELLNLKLHHLLAYCMLPSRDSKPSAGFRPLE